MKSYYYITHLLFVAIFIGLFSACVPDESSNSDAHLGKINIQVTGADEAIPHFTEGLLLLHSFEYPDAREAFVKAQEIDSTFVMAYWGEAMTHNHNLWGQQDFEKATAALVKLAPTREERIALAQTELEKDFMRAVETLYGNEGTKKERDIKYRDFMEGLHTKYPDNHEISSLYALSILGAVPLGRDEEEYGKGARIAQGIISENPHHPGALHYLIHSYDDPYHATLALDAANNYSKVAPDAAHALHMPSHIYVAMGMWREVVASNEASWQASVDRMIRKELDNDAQSYHALHWLQYGYLQQGRYKESQKIMSDMVKYVDEKPSKRARTYMIDMQAAFLVETNDWDNEVAAITVDKSDLKVSYRSKFNFIKAMEALHKGNPTEVKSIVQLIEYERQMAEIHLVDDAVTACAAAGWMTNVSSIDVDQSEVLAYELRALLATEKDKLEEAENWLKKAIELESKISYSFGPPKIPKPSHELYGEWLLKQKRYEEAIAMFDEALERGPRRALSLQGKLTAAKALGDEATAKTIQAELDDVRSLSAESQDIAMK